MWKSMWKRNSVEEKGFPREKQARWDLENLRTVSTKMIPGEYRILRNMCAAQGTTVYSLVRQLLRLWMMETAKREGSRPET